MRIATKGSVKSTRYSGVLPYVSCTLMVGGGGYLFLSLFFLSVCL